MLTVDALKKHVHYNKLTGVFTRKLPSQTTFKYKANTVMGSVDVHGYIIIGLFGAKYRANQLAWFYMTGTWAKLVDHKDTDRQNNRWRNLREANKSENAGNTKLRCTNTSGARGVCYDKNNKLWQSRIGNVHLGYYKSKNDAVYVREAMAKLYFGDFNYDDKQHKTIFCKSNVPRAKRCVQRRNW